MPVQLEVLAVRESNAERNYIRRHLRLRIEGPIKGDAALLHDLSESGFLIETTDILDVGEVIQIDLPEAIGRSAEVIWHTGQLYGCQFRRPISKAAVSASLLRSSPTGTIDALLPLDSLPVLPIDNSGVNFTSTAGQRLRKNRGIILFGLGVISWAILALAAL